VEDPDADTATTEAHAAHLKTSTVHPAPEDMDWSSEDEKCDIRDLTTERGGSDTLNIVQSLRPLA
jgi:hypothetical protein